MRNVLEAARGHDQGESAALSQYATDRQSRRPTNVAIFVRDGQTQARAAEHCEDGCVALGEGLEQRGKTSSRMPMPVSITSIRTVGRSSRHCGRKEATIRTLPCSVNLTALLAKLRIACRRRHRAENRFRHCAGIFNRQRDAAIFGAGAHRAGHVGQKRRDVAEGARPTRACRPRSSRGREYR